VSLAASDLSRLALSRTKEVSREEEDAESRDMAKAEVELESSPLEVLSEPPGGDLGVAVLSSAATVCCGGQEAESKVTTELLHTDETGMSSEKSPTAGTDVNQDRSQRWLIVLFLFFFTTTQPLLFVLLSAPRRSSAVNPGSLMFVRLRVQSSAGRKKKGAGGLQLGSSQPLQRRDAWLALSQERYSSN